MEKIEYHVKIRFRQMKLKCIQNVYGELSM